MWWEPGSCTRREGEWTAVGDVGEEHDTERERCCGKGGVAEILSFFLFHFDPPALRRTQAECVELIAVMDVESQDQ